MCVFFPIKCNKLFLSYAGYAFIKIDNREYLNIYLDILKIYFQS